VRQRPAAQHGTECYPERKSLWCGEADRGFSMLLGCLTDWLGVLANALSALGLADLWGIWPTASPVWLQIVIIVVLGDALEYFYHRLCHTSPLLGRLHMIHHTPVRLHTLKGGRHHFLYALGRGIVVWLPLLVLGAPAELVFWQFVAVTITGLVGHANIRCRIPACMHRLAVTPEFHRLHHAADPLRVAMGEAGIHDDPIPRRFIEEIMSPITYRELVAHRRQAT